MADGTRNIVEAIKAVGGNRFLGLATPSVAEPRDRSTLKAKVLPVIAGLTEAVRGSDLDWTIARISSPNDRRAKETIRSGFLGRERSAQP